MTHSYISCVMKQDYSILICTHCVTLLLPVAWNTMCSQSIYNSCSVIPPSKLRWTDMYTSQQIPLKMPSKPLRPAPLNKSKWRKNQIQQLKNRINKGELKNEIRYCRVQGKIVYLHITPRNARNRDKT